MEFRLLGPLEARSQGRPVDLGSQKQRFLLGVLLLEANRPVELTRLMDLLWPEGRPRSAKATVYTLVWRLRTALADAGAEQAGVRLLTTGQGYVLQTGAERIDVTRFRLLVERARAAAEDTERVMLLQQAQALWRGPALAGSAPPHLLERLCRGLDEARIDAIEDRIDAELRLGRHHAVVGELTELVGQHRLRERLIAAHMLALYRCGRAVDALASYRLAKRQLAEEFGLDPGRQLRQLELHILRGDASLEPVTPPGSEPPPPAPAEDGDGGGRRQQRPRPGQLAQARRRVRPAPVTARRRPGPLPRRARDRTGAEVSPPPADLPAAHRLPGRPGRPGLSGRPESGGTPGGHPRPGCPACPDCYRKIRSGTARAIAAIPSSFGCRWSPLS